MTEEEIIKVVSAYKAGKKIRTNPKNDKHAWYYVDNPKWNFALNDYRVEPDNLLSIEDDLIGKVLKTPAGTKHLIIAQFEKVIQVAGYGHVKYEDIPSKFTHLDEEELP